MPLVETESLILKTYDLADADKIVLFLAREEGIVRGVAKGAKRLKSRFGSGLEPFTVVRLTYFQKEVLELVSIQKTELISSYFASASDPEFLQKFSYLADILIESSPPHDPNETLYRMVRACLDAAVDDPGGLAATGLYFEVWLLRLSGYLPDWRGCAMCGRTFERDDTAFLGNGHRLVCSGCASSAYAAKVEPSERFLVDAALRQPPAEFLRTVRSAPGRVDVISGLLKRIISQALGRPVAERPIHVLGNNAG